MSEEKEKSIIIDKDGIPKYKVVIVEYWELLQGGRNNSIYIVTSDSST